MTIFNVLKKYKNILVVLVLVVSISFPAKADPRHIIPLEAVIGMILLFTILGIGASLMISMLLRLILEKIRKEKRRHIWFMTFCTLIFPVLYAYLVDEYNLLYEFEGDHGYEAKERFYNYTLFSLIPFGFLVGYFITPLKKARKENNLKVLD